MSGSGTKFKKRDLQRYRKIYPYVRRQPKYVYEADKNVVIEVGEIEFNNQSLGVYRFTQSFPSAPTVTGISVETGTSTADVNVFIKLVSTTEVHFETSQAFTGKVHFQAMWIES